MIFYAGENVEKLAVAFVRVIRPVAREIGQPQLVCEPEQRLVDVLFVRQVVPLQLDVETARENVVEPRESLLALMFFYAVMQEAVRSARETEQPGRVLLDIASRRKMFALFMPQFHGRDQTAEVLIATQIKRHERQKAAVVHRDLGADHRLNALLLCLEMEPHRSRNRVAVEHSDRRHPKLGRTRRKILGQRARR